MRFKRALIFSSLIIVTMGLVAFLIGLWPRNDFSAGADTVGVAPTSVNADKSSSESGVSASSDPDPVSTAKPAADSLFSPNLLNDLWESGQPAGGLFESLLDAARAGDGAAAFHLYDLSRRCMGVPRTDAELLERTVQIERSTQLENVQVRIQALERSFMFCEGLPPGTLSAKESIDLLRLAAQAGVVSARREYLTAVLSRYSTAADAVNHANEIRREMNLAAQYLNANVSMGDQGSLLNLGDIYSSDVTGVRDVTRAAALFRLHGELVGGDPLPQLVEMSRTFSAEELAEVERWLEFYRELYGRGG